jgi:hypothetical protein
MVTENTTECRFTLRGFRFTPHETIEAINNIAAPSKRKSLPVKWDLKLVREPDNAYDPNAVKVEVFGYKIGYVHRDECASVMKWVEAREAYTFVKIEPNEADFTVILEG